MPIAQHFVAGEVDIRPHPANPADIKIDADALAEFTCDTTNLPWIVFRAAHRAAHLHGVPARARALLSALARTVDAHRPYAAIYARRELLTGRAMQSMRTFYRSLDDLEEAGLIVRPPQRRYGQAGLFGRAYLHLTEQTAQLLGLVDAPAIASAPEPDHHEVVAPEVLSLQQPSASVADGAIYKDLYPASSQKRQPGQLPSDLERLRRLGFHEFLIFKLMREAREHQKLLSDVVDVAWEHLRKAERPINYLRALLRSTADFAWQARNKRQATAQRHEVDQEALRVATVVQQNAGGIFFDCNSSRRISVASDASMVTVHECGEAAPRVSAGNWQVNFVAAIESGHLVPATTEREAAFESKRQRGREDQQAAPRLQPTHAMPRILTEAAGERLAQMKNMLRATVAGVRAH
ncbi:hypothetical protein R69658_05838 [Paraburkholderia aspalathi]|uniref:Replication protein O n=1 Tax=Paraburkholderia aspalathi TaxID=1324617 RepID=A0ABN7MPN2_9BURK|nr:hypothetical protein [Paraburkholderia aspalathi]MBK3822163.1 hypothetical protein [Paraburkholderia aspalathi]MBK3833997.1 hypothetical protein [Paraburkholderia aspalathi]MBK3863708.1 hypothetical protein [Paraburkholderia aspalathi]CAE6820758.1 hypothetical protein R69658_05838 [Paraburkholderia aspalathi]